jgi:hypothetical protein
VSKKVGAIGKLGFVNLNLVLCPAHAKVVCFAHVLKITALASN